MRSKILFLAPIAGLALCVPGGARAELIELTNGHVIQGDILAGQTTEEGLALNVYDTNGVVVVKWDHIVEARRKQLRRDNGIDLPEETVEYVDGHRVRTTNGEIIEGVAENPRDASPLRMKTRTGVKEYDRSTLAGLVEDTKIDGLLVYTVEELYQKIRDENRPETSAANKYLAQRCMNIGAYDHAKDHLTVCKNDPAFMDTPEGKAVDAMLRQCEVMIRAKGADDLKKQIVIAGHDNDHNKALKLLNQLDTEFKDEVIRKAIGFDLLEARTLKARDQYFQRQVALDVFKFMDALIDVKSREKKPRTDAAAAPGGGAAAGTLAGARQWENREMYAQLWEKVAADTGLTKEELEKYWKERTVKTVRKASYGSGSFIVVKRAPAQKPGAPAAPPPRRPPGSSGGNNKSNTPDKPAKVDKPLTEEEWWDLMGPTDRQRWLTANFVETSGLFEVLRTDQTNCQACGGLGAKKTVGTDGNDDSHFCEQCNGVGVVRSVNYR